MRKSAIFQIAIRFLVFFVPVAVLLAIKGQNPFIMCVDEYSMSIVIVLFTSYFMLRASTDCCDSLFSWPIGLASYPTLFIYGFRIVYMLNKTLFIVLNSQHEDVLFCLGNFPFPCLYDNTSKGISQHFSEWKLYKLHIVVLYISHIVTQFTQYQRVKAMFIT